MPETRDPVFSGIMKRTHVDGTETWYPEVKIHNRRRSLGTYDTRDEAVAALIFVKTIRGRPRLNLPERQKLLTGLRPIPPKNQVVLDYLKTLF